MAHWIRFSQHGAIGFGQLAGDTIRVFEGEMFGTSVETGEHLPLADVKVLTPCEPTKMVALWNNFRGLAEKLGQAIPPEPLYFLKGNNAFHPHGEPIRVPAAYAGKVVYEGELGVVIGKRTHAVGEDEAASYIFGYTCINDVTRPNYFSRTRASRNGRAQKALIRSACSVR